MSCETLKTAGTDWKSTLCVRVCVSLRDRRPDKDTNWIRLDMFFDF